MLGCEYSAIDYAKFINDEWQKELQASFKLQLEKEIYNRMEYTPIFSTLYGFGTSAQQFKKSDLIPTKIIYNNKTTVCYFKDGSKEIVHCAEGEEFVKEVGVMSCIMKKLFSSRNDFKRLVNSGYVQPEKKTKEKKEVSGNVEVAVTTEEFENALAKVVAGTKPKAP